MTVDETKNWNELHSTGQKAVELAKYWRDRALVAEDELALAIKELDKYAQAFKQSLN